MASTNESEFTAQTRRLVSAVSADPERYGLTRETADALAEVAGQYFGAVPKSLGGDAVELPPLRSLQTCAKVAARGALRAALKPVVRAIKQNPAVTDALRAELGLPPRPITGLAKWRAEVERAAA